MYVMDVIPYAIYKINTKNSKLGLIKCHYQFSVIPSFYKYLIGHSNNQ